MNDLIAYCGLDCEKCDARIATLSKDEELREKTARLWSELNGVDIPTEMINCEGCRVDGAKAPFCDSMCAIRKCAASKNLNTCSECEKMEECATLATITVNSAEALENLKSIKI